MIDRWILSRTARAIAATDRALRNYEFKPYADRLYDFIWRDFCDWYIEAIKPTIADDASQQRVLTSVIDVILRLLHPAMPFVTEKLFEHLNAVAPQRGDLTIEGFAKLTIPPSELLINAGWPKSSYDPPQADDAEAAFSLVRDVVASLREARTTYKVPPRQNVECSIKAPAALGEKLREHAALIGTLANVTVSAIGPDTQRPDDAAAAVIGEAEAYLHGLIDADAERRRLDKAIAEKEKAVKALEGRLSNENYVKKAPANLVQETRDQLAAAKNELETLKKQRAEL